MNQPIVIARRQARAGLRVTFFLFLPFVFLAAFLAGAKAQEPRVDACADYRTYAEIGGEGSGPAQAFKRVCDRIGPIEITQSCLVYYTRITDKQFPPDADFRKQLVKECEASMPGGTTLEKGVATAEAEPVAPAKLAETDTAMSSAANPEIYGPPIPCVGGHECGMTPTTTTSPAQDEDIKTAEAANPEPEPQAVEDENVAADATEETDADPEADATAVASANESAREIELAFWQAAVESGDEALFAAYLERYPDGVFVPIAKTRVGSETSAPPVLVSRPGPEAAPVPAVVEDPPTDPTPQTPEALYLAAREQLDAAYQLEPAARDAEIGAAAALLESSGAGGYGLAYVELGGLVENGIGMDADRDLALDYYRQAGAAGALEGYYRALMLYDQAGDGADYVETFFNLYAVDAEMALASFDDVGTSGPMALQRYLAGTGHYRGPVDGRFDASARAALSAFASGAAPARQEMVVTATAAPAPEVPEVVVTANATPAQSVFIEPPRGPRPPRPPAAIPADGLAVELQSALTRVGCYFDEIDGRWGPASVSALSAFNRMRGVHFPTGRPSVEALSAVQRSPGVVCR